MSDRGTYAATYAVMFDSQEWMALSVNAKLVFLTLKNSRIGNMAGIFLLGAGEKYTLGEQTGLSVKQIGAAIDELQRDKWVIYADNIIWLRNHLRYNSTLNMNNPNHRSRVAKTIAMLPTAKIVADFCKYYDFDLPEGYPDTIEDTITDTIEDTITDTIGDTPATLPDGIGEHIDIHRTPYTVHRTPETVAASPPALAPEHEIIAQYNEICGHVFPKTKSTSPARMRALKARIKDNPDFDWPAFFCRAVASSFLTGRNDKGWRVPGIDWLLTPSKFDRLNEGGYDDPPESPLSGLSKSGRESAENLRSAI